MTVEIVMFRRFHQRLLNIGGKVKSNPGKVSSDFQLLNLFSRTLKFGLIISCNR
jgi:hypothetical protein